MEVITPKILPGMEETRNLIRKRVNARKVCAFPPIAVGTGKPKIFLFISPSMLFGDDVLHMKTKSRIRLWDATIFTPPQRTIPNSINLLPVHVFQIEEQSEASNNLASALSMERTEFTWTIS